MSAERAALEGDLDVGSLRAVLLVGGKGTRLRPYTATFPKPLVPLGDRPILEILVRRLLRSGIRDIVLAIGHLGELVQAYFSHRPDLLAQMHLTYVHEDEPLGTAGALSLVPGIDQTFLVMNGDVLTDLDFAELVAFHRRRGALLTIATHRRVVQIDLGVLELGDDDRVVGYLEKPTYAHPVSMGVYVFEPAVLDYMEPGAHLDFPDLVLRLLAAGDPVAAYVTDCLWLDIGRPDDYAAAQELIADDPEVFR
jgi:NDP-sugar pyrophosphorylase family protein